MYVIRASLFRHDFVRKQAVFWTKIVKYKYGLVYIKAIH